MNLPVSRAAQPIRRSGGDAYGSEADTVIGSEEHRPAPYLFDLFSSHLGRRLTGRKSTVASLRGLLCELWLVRPMMDCGSLALPDLHIDRVPSHAMATTSFFWLAEVGRRERKGGLGALQKTALFGFRNRIALSSGFPLISC